LVRSVLGSTSLGILPGLLFWEYLLHHLGFERQTRQRWTRRAEQKGSRSLPLPLPYRAAGFFTALPRRRCAAAHYANTRTAHCAHLRAALPRRACLPRCTTPDAPRPARLPPSTHCLLPAAPVATATMLLPPMLPAATTACHTPPACLPAVAAACLPWCLEYAAAPLYLLACLPS